MQNRNLSPSEKQYFFDSLDSFKKVLSQYSNIPVITKGTTVFLDADLKIACGMESPEDGFVIKAPPGLPVKVLSKNQKSIKVLILDTRDQSLDNPNGGSCDGEVYIPAKIPISNYWPN